MKENLIQITLLLFIYNSAVFAKAQQTLAKVITFKGEVIINKTKLTSPFDAYLKEGDRLIAKGSKSFFIVEYKDKSRFMIRDGEIVIDKLIKSESKIELLKGAIFSYVNPKAQHSFKVKTKRASFAVRGTKFWLKEDSKESYLCVCEGAVLMENDRSQLTLKAGEDGHIQTSTQKLSKAPANEQMWKMATDSLKELGLPVLARP